MYLMFDTYLFAGDHLFLFPFFSTGSRRRGTTATAARPSGSSRVLSSGKIKNRGQYFTLTRGRGVFPTYASWNFYSNWMIVWGKVVYFTNNIIKIGNFETLFPLSLSKENSLLIGTHTVKNIALSTHIANRRVSRRVLTVFVHLWRSWKTPTHLEPD